MEISFFAQSLAVLGALPLLPQDRRVATPEFFLGKGGAMPTPELQQFFQSDDPVLAEHDVVFTPAQVESTPPLIRDFHPGRECLELTYVARHDQTGAEIPPVLTTNFDGAASVIALDGAEVARVLGHLRATDIRLIAA